MLRNILTVIFIIVCIALVVLVMSQESKSSGLTGTVSGMADTYWGKNKGRSREGKLVKGTAILGVLFLIMTIVLNMNW